MTSANRMINKPTIWRIPSCRTFAKCEEVSAQTALRFTSHVAVQLHIAKGEKYAQIYTDLEMIYGLSPGGLQICMGATHLAKM